MGVSMTRRIVKLGLALVLLASCTGHERIVTAGDDLQYACIQPLVTPIVCEPDDVGCECGAADLPSYQDNSPLCQAADGSYSTTQRFAKAYPGLRQLEVLKGFGDVNPTNNSVVASICARNVTEPSSGDFGYRPAVRALVERLIEFDPGRICLPRSLNADEEGNLPCVIVEASLPADGECNCTSERVRAVLSDGLQEVVRGHMLEADYCQSEADCAKYCLCEVPTARSADGADAQDDCRNNAVTVPETKGWCYVDPAQDLGNPELVANCPDTGRRRLRFVGGSDVEPGPVTFLVCGE